MELSNYNFVRVLSAHNRVDVIHLLKDELFRWELLSALIDCRMSHARSILDCTDLDEFDKALILDIIWDQGMEQYGSVYGIRDAVDLWFNGETF